MRRDKRNRKKTNKKPTDPLYSLVDGEGDAALGLGYVLWAQHVHGEPRELSRQLKHVVLITADANSKES